MLSKLTQSSWWVVFPTANAGAGQACANLWRSVGWRTAVFTDRGKPTVECDYGMTGDYRGVAASFNLMAKALMSEFPVKAMIYGNDDLFPWMNADSETFGAAFLEKFPDTLGVAQATGIWLDNYRHSAASPLIGAEFARRVNRGKGALWEEYRHYYDDVELKHIAEKIGRYAELPTISIKHLHHTYGFGDTMSQEQRRRAHEAHRRSEKLFEERKAAGFPGHELID